MTNLEWQKRCDAVDASKYTDLSLIECGREKCVPDKVFRYTPKRYHMFHIILDGKGYFESNGTTYDVKAGSGFYIEPFQSPKYYPDKETPWSYVWVGFDGIKAENLLSACLISKENPIFTDSSKSRDLRFKAVDMYDSYRETGSLGLSALSDMYKIFAILSGDKQIQSPQKISTKETYAKEACEFIANNYRFHITISDIAASLGVSASYLCIIFTEMYGISPKQYLTSYRMDIAKSLLRSGGHKVKEVGSLVGYQNQLHFSAEFKNVFGMSPLAYCASLPQTNN